VSRTFVIGDVHGHVDRLALLLERAGALAPSPDVEVVQLGDLGHYGADTHERDLLVWQLAEKLHLTVLWGNHDYANVIPDRHGFRGHDLAFPEVMEIVCRVKPKFAVERHGYLLTHAGLAPRFMPPTGTPTELLAEILNACEGQPVIDDISYRRGGFATQGGILWRDESEPLGDIRQVFGHSQGDVRRMGPNQQSWCIDVGTKDNGQLVGLWLPDMKIVAVGPDADIHETPWPDAE